MESWETEPGDRPPVARVRSPVSSPVRSPVSSPARSRDLLHLARTVLAETAGLVAPRRCPCGREGTRLCGDCRQLIAGPAVRVESRCDALQLLDAARVRETRVVPATGPSAAGVTGSRPRPAPESLPAGVDLRPLLPVLALGAYRGELRSLVLAWKNGGRADLVDPLAAGLSRALAPWGDEEQLVLVPVPSRRAARIRRGEDHVGELVRQLGRHGLGAPAALVSAPSTSQHGADARGRRQRRFALRRSPRGPGRVVIVDDVVTTGWTLRAMHGVLTDAGAEVLGAVVVAAARMPGPPEVPARRPARTDRFPSSGEHPAPP